MNIDKHKNELIVFLSGVLICTGLMVLEGTEGVQAQIDDQQCTLDQLYQAVREMKPEPEQKRWIKDGIFMRRVKLKVKEYSTHHYKACLEAQIYHPNNE